MADIKLAHIPYRGSGPAQADLVGGHVAMAIQTIPPAIAQIRSGLVRAIAVTGATRSPIFPDLPTVAESGLPGYEAVIHYGIVAPAGTPRTIVERLNADLRAALTSADGEALKRAGISAVGIANNVHYGEAVITASIARLDQLGIRHVGAGANLAAARAPAILERDGIRFGFLQRSSVYWPTNHEARKDAA